MGIEVRRGELTAAAIWFCGFDFNIDENF